ncbi:MAG: hypothetical protein KAJ49_08420 [Arcobacteraceae bacterium]|nr:hypothetical protein [Arcobacteraceae bacterium]
MIKHTILLLLSISTFLTASADLIVYFDNEYNCIYGAKFEIVEDEPLKLYTKNTRRSSWLRRWSDENSGEIKIYMRAIDCDSNNYTLDENIKNSFPAIVNYLHNNEVQTDSNGYIYDISTHNKYFTDTIPQNFINNYTPRLDNTVLKELGLNSQYLNLLFGLSGILISSFFLYRIS